MARSRYRVPDPRLLAQAHETSVDLRRIPEGDPHDLYAQVGVDARALGRRFADAHRRLLDAAVDRAIAEARLAARHATVRRRVEAADRWERWLRETVAGALRDGVALTFRFERLRQLTLPRAIVRLEAVLPEVDLQRPTLLGRTLPDLIDRGAALLARLRADDRDLRALAVARDRAIDAQDAARAGVDAALEAHDQAVHAVRALLGEVPPGGDRGWVGVPRRLRRPDGGTAGSAVGT